MIEGKNQDGMNILESTGDLTNIKHDSGRYDLPGCVPVCGGAAKDACGGGGAIEACVPDRGGNGEFPVRGGGIGGCVLACCRRPEPLGT